MQIKYSRELENLFFTSDTHFNHDNIIKYCSRPFHFATDMNETLILNWNKVVPVNGTVFILGDIAFNVNTDSLRTLLSRLHGEKHLILGNHDYQQKLERQAIRELFGGRVYDVCSLRVVDKEVEGERMRFFMSHYPHLFWERRSLHLHGHVHSGPNSVADEVVPYHPRRYDVGVDNNNYFPVSYNELKVMFTKRIMKEK